MQIPESDLLGIHDEGAADTTPYDGFNPAAMDCAAAGFVLLCAANYILIWLYAAAQPPAPSFPAQYPKETMLSSSSAHAV